MFFWQSGQPHRRMNSLKPKRPCTVKSICMEWVQSRAVANWTVHVLCETCETHQATVNNSVFLASESGSCYILLSHMANLYIYIHNNIFIYHTYHIYIIIYILKKIYIWCVWYIYKYCYIYIFLMTWAWCDAIGRTSIMIPQPSILDLKTSLGDNVWATSTNIKYSLYIYNTIQ